MNQIKNVVHFEAWAELFVERFIKVLIIMVIVLLFAKLIHITCQRLLTLARRANHGGAKHSLDREKRMATVVGLIDTTLRVLLFGAAFLMILREFGLDITPFLTGAGIAGVALGFGAQSLVKDVISGFFLLLEDQIRLGDVVKINNLLSGSVERMQLRVTALRDGDGTLHIVPNGEIKSVSNMTYEFGQAVVDIPVRYETDVRRLTEILDKVLRDFEKDPAWISKLRAAPSVAGIVDFKPTHMVVEIVARTEPHERWSVATELRRRARLAIDGQGVALMPGITLP